MQNEIDFESKTSTGEEVNIQREAITSGLEMSCNGLSLNGNLGVKAAPFTISQLRSYADKSDISENQYRHSQGFCVFLTDRERNIELDFDVFIYPCESKDIFIVKIYDAYSFAYVHREGHVERITKEKIIRDTFRGHVNDYLMIYSDVQKKIIRTVTDLLFPRDNPTTI